MAARVMVVAAHPDDETIGASVAMSSARELRVVHATDGVPGSERFVPTEYRGRPEAYRGTRQEELAQALALLPPTVTASWTNVGLGDQEAVFELPKLVAVLVDELAHFQPQVVVTHAFEGGHPDHDAVSIATWAALRMTVDRGRPLPEWREMGIYHGRPPRWCALEGTFGGGGQVETLSLDPEQRDRKARMLACFGSQAPVLRDAPRDRECHRTLAVDQALALATMANQLRSRPYQGPLWYEALGFPVDWTTFVEAARRGLAAMDLEPSRDRTDHPSA